METREIIRKKRDGGKLHREEIESLLRGYLQGMVRDYQMAAFLMASFLKGLDDEETIWFTDIMVSTGKRLDLSEIPNPKVDKHSTGGVGDKVSIVLAPLLSAADVVVPMIAGRGLGHTGGTIDKLEAIPGFRTDLSLLELRNTLWETGVVISAQSEEIAPLDRRIYELRNATATVESIPLIASSIMSKKLAEGLNGLVLDVKTGKGAFMKTIEEAEQLARKMVEIGNASGVKTIALITDMDEPLGRAVGNSLEIRECINILKGREEPGLSDLILTLGAYMLVIAEEMVVFNENDDSVSFKDIEITDELLDAKRLKLQGLIDSGDALSKFVEMVESQGGNPEVVANPALMPVAKNILPVEAPEDGIVQEIDAEGIGRASVLLGAGRQRPDESIDHAAGIILNRKSSQEVKKGDFLAVLHYNDDRNLEAALKLVRESFRIGKEPPPERELIKKVIF
ncbi:MAG TPA: thymidine phosphorylase [Nitrospirae bacterium]|nr:thymidine phosphorylase [Nitrospirota bacterium]